MSKILVYHVKDGVAPNGRSLLGEIGEGEIPVDFENNHELVAEVEVHSEGMRSLDEAYKLTQNIEQCWTKNSFVEVKGTPGQTRFRSTHIGDVLVMNKKRYVCVNFGWKELRFSDQKLGQGAQEGIIMRPKNNYGKR